MVHRRTPQRRQTPRRRRTPRRRQTPRRTLQRTPQRRQTPRRLIRKCDKSLKAGLSKKGDALRVAGIVGLGAASLVGVGAYTTSKQNKTRAALNPDVIRQKQEKLIEINSYIDNLNNKTNDSNLDAQSPKVILVIGTSGAGKSSVINELTGKKTCTVISGVKGGQELCTETDDHNNLYIETLGLGTSDAQSENSLRDIASIVMHNNGINLILFVMAAGRLNEPEQLNGMLVKQLFPRVPVVFVRPRLDGDEETEKQHDESLSAIRQLFHQQQLCDYVFGTFKHIELQVGHDGTELKKWEDQIAQSVNKLKQLITTCATKDRIKTSFTDNIKNVFSTVYQLGLVGLITLVTKNKDPFQKQEISSNI